MNSEINIDIRYLYRYIQYPYSIPKVIYSISKFETEIDIFDSKLGLKAGYSITLYLFSGSCVLYSILLPGAICTISRTVNPRKV